MATPNSSRLPRIAAIVAMTLLVVLIGARLADLSVPIRLESPLAVMTCLVGIAAFWFWLAESGRYRLFAYLPPLIWIYATPIVLANTGVLPFSSPAYDGLRSYGLPLFIALMLLKIDVLGAVRVMGKGVLVMLIGSIGVVVGALVACALFVRAGLLEADSWVAFGTLAGSWIGGTGNMNAAWAALDGRPDHMTMAAVADNLVYILWLPVLLSSASFAERFNRWSGVANDRLARMDRAAADIDREEAPPRMVHLLYLALSALLITSVSLWLADHLPEIALGGQTIVSRSTWVILLVTTLALAASGTRLRQLPGSEPIAMALIYVFVASIGARANLATADLGQIGWFVAAAYVWIVIHGLFILAGARIFKVDVHTLAIASAANIGGAASAPLVAAHHRPSLVPASILMALIGYALGNYLAILTGRLAQMIVS